MLKVEGFADKLMTVTESHAKEISERLCKALRENPKTPSFRLMTQNECILHIMNFFQNLRRIYFCKKPYTEVFEYFTNYAEMRYKAGVPSYEAIYVLIMIRRQIWLVTESHALVLTGLDLRRSQESINKMIRVFDHGMYAIIKRYEELYAMEKEQREA